MTEGTGLAAFEAKLRTAHENDLAERRRQGGAARALLQRVGTASGLSRQYGPIREAIAKGAAPSKPVADTARRAGVRPASNGPGPVKPGRFAHLMAATGTGWPTPSTPSLPPIVSDDDARAAATGDQIMAAAAKARTPTGTGVKPPSGIAARIIAAGRKRRGETA